jgi:hypothetical protein
MMATKKVNPAKSGPKGDTLKDIRVVAGDIATKEAPGTKTSGIKMRGAGAATKGTMCRGPMA